MCMTSLFENASRNLRVVYSDVVSYQEDVLATDMKAAHQVQHSWAGLSYLHKP